MAMMMLIDAVGGNDYKVSFVVVLSVFGAGVGDVVLRICVLRTTVGAVGNMREGEGDRTHMGIDPTG